MDENNEEIRIQYSVREKINMLNMATRWQLRAPCLRAAG
jgi:hypothetical protein